MTKVFVGNAKYELTNESGENMIVGPNEFAEIPDSFTGDLTYRLAVQAGVIKPYVSMQEANKIEKTYKPEKVENPKTKEKPAPKKASEEDKDKGNGK